MTDKRLLGGLEWYELRVAEMFAKVEAFILFAVNFDGLLVLFFFWAAADKESYKK